MVANKVESDIRDSLSSKVIQFPGNKSNLRLVYSSTDKDLDNLVQIEDFRNKTPEHDFLQGSGFDVWMELGAMILNQGNGLSLERIKEDLKGNLLGFYYEYLRGLAVLPNPVDLVKEKGRKRLISRFGNRDLTETIDESERFGAVKQVFREDVTTFLQTAKAGDLIAINSAPGWSGLKNNLGQEIIYPDTQTYAFKINEQGQLEALTFVSDLNFEQGKTLLGSLEVDNKFTGTKQEQLAQMVKRPIILRAKNGDDNFRLLLEKIQSAKGSQIMRATNHKISTFNEAFKLLENKDSLLSLDGRVKAVLDGFESLLDDSFNSFKEDASKVLAKYPNLLFLEREKAIELVKKELINYTSFYSLADQMCVTIGKLHLSIKTQNSKLKTENFNPDIPDNPYLPDRSLSLKMFQEIIALPGCAGGGLSFAKGFIPTPLGMREVIFTQTKKEWSYHIGDCIRPGCENPKNVEVGPCSICKSCEAIIDKSEWIDKKYGMLGLAA